MTPVSVVSGTSSIVLGLPHTGTWVPDEIFNQLNPLGQTLADTDWHVDRLYHGLIDDVTTVRANFHRYVIDANRDPSGESLYPGMNTTGLVPLTDFDGLSIWDVEPTVRDIEERRTRYHAAYHQALSDELERVRDINGVAILYDCHSIRSRIPFLFDGQLPDFNIGTNSVTTCDERILKVTEDVCQNAQGYSCVTDGRFKGGWTTRDYGRPGDNIHAIQMELAQITHLAEEVVPFRYDEEKAERLRQPLQQILAGLLTLAPSLKSNS